MCPFITRKGKIILTQGIIIKTEVTKYKLFSVTISFKYPNTHRHKTGRWIEIRSRVWVFVFKGDETSKEYEKEYELMKEFAVSETVMFMSSYSSILLLEDLVEYRSTEFEELSISEIGRKTGISDISDILSGVEVSEIVKGGNYTVLFDCYDHDYGAVRFKEEKTYSIKTMKKVREEMLQPHLNLFLPLVLQREEEERTKKKIPLKDIMKELGRSDEEIKMFDDYLKKKKKKKEEIL